MYIIGILPLILLAESGTASPMDAEGFCLAGAAKAKITPAGRVYLAGFRANRRSVGVHDDLYARCLILKKGEDWLTLVSLDLIGLLNGDVREIVQRVKPLVGGNVIIASTHTHSGPDTIGLWGSSLFGLLPIRSGKDGEYVNFLKKEVSRAILDAATSLEEAEITCAQAEVHGLSKNIRRKYSLDRDLIVMGVRSTRTRRPMASLVNFACHPESLWSDNRLITADFAGYLCNTMERRLGGVVLYFNGALGGMVTVNVRVDERRREVHTFPEAERIGTHLAMVALGAMEDAEVNPVYRIQAHRKVVAIPAKNWRFRLAKWMGVIDRPLEENRVLTELWRIDLGGAQIITIPGEILPNLGLKLKEHMRGKYRLLLGLANDEVGYVLSSADYHDELYSYERSMSIGPEIGPLIYKGVIDLLSPH